MKRVCYGAVLILTVVGLSACGSSSGGTSGGTSSDASSNSGSSAPISEITWGSGTVPRVDPVTAFNYYTVSVVAPVEQSLMTYTKEGKVIPSLASSVENPDPTTYVYKVKKGIKFSDGQPLTGEDVVFSLNRNMSDSSQTASNYENVSSITLRGGDEIVFKLKKPDVAFENLPAFCGQILEKEAAIKGGLSKLGTASNLPVGTGPYKFASFSPDSGVKMVLNPYWQGEKPTVQKVNIVFLKEESATALAMRSGEIDGSFTTASERNFKFPGISILTTPGTGQFALSMNTQTGPFSDVHLRKAIAYATDREGMVNAVFGGAAEINETLTPIALYTNVAPKSEVESEFGMLPTYEFNLEKAKEELAKSAYPHGLSVTFDASPEAVKIAQILAADAAKIGIKMTVNPMTESAYLEMFYGPREKIGLTMDWYSAFSPDPGTLMNWWLSPKQAIVNGLNSASYKNPQVGKLLGEQQEEADGSKRLGLITNIFQIMKEEVPYVPLFAPTQFMVISEKYVFNEYSAWTQEFVPWPMLIRSAS